MKKPYVPAEIEILYPGDPGYEEARGEADPGSAEACTGSLAALGMTGEMPGMTAKDAGEEGGPV